MNISTLARFVVFSFLFLFLNFPFAFKSEAKTHHLWLKISKKIQGITPFRDPELLLVSHSRILSLKKTSLCSIYNKYIQTNHNFTIQKYVKNHAFKDSLFYEYSLVFEDFFCTQGHLLSFSFLNTNRKECLENLGNHPSCLSRVIFSLTNRPTPPAPVFKKTIYCHTLEKKNYISCSVSPKATHLTPNYTLQLPLDKNSFVTIMAP